MNLAKKTEI